MDRSKIKRYRTQDGLVSHFMLHGETFEAMVLRPPNIMDAHAWVGGKMTVVYTGGDYQYTLYLNDGFETAVMNRDVLIKLEDGSFHSMDVETFNATYILVDEPQSRNLAIPDNNESMSAMEILEVQDYETIPRKVQAVRLTVANAAAVAEWCNGYECLGVSDKPTTTWVEVPVPQTLFERRHRAYPGDWILRTPQGRYKVVHNASFMSDFRDANRSE